MKLARCRVEIVASKPEENVRKIYGGLCHEFPVMVRTCGLCQAVAFSLDKAQSNEAHSLLLDDLSAVLGVARNQLPTHIEGMKTTEYMLATRKVLSAWLFFKRFAVSILRVRNASEAGQD